MSKSWYLSKTLWANVIAAIKTDLGQIVASMVMILGYSIIAVPTGIITAELGLSSAQQKKVRTCAACGHARHDADALHCSQCGAGL